MPYLVLLAGIIVGLYAFLRFVAKATPAQIKHFFLTAFLAIYALFMVELALTGRVVTSIILFLVLVPFFIRFARQKTKALKALPAPKDKNSP